MEGIPTYHPDEDTANRNRHGLEVGDTIDAGMGPSVEVVDVDEQGVRFDDGDTAAHVTVVRNMSDLELL
jgi:hypothetical protein